MFKNLFRNYSLFKRNLLFCKDSNKMKMTLYQFIEWLNENQVKFKNYYIQNNSQNAELWPLEQEGIIAWLEEIEDFACEKYNL